MSTTKSLITNTDQLPPSVCVDGYPWSQLEEIMDEQQIRRLALWMRGQTQAICDARHYNHDEKQYEPSGCDQAHGPVIYTWDLHTFIDAAPIVDW